MAARASELQGDVEDLGDLQDEDLKRAVKELVVRVTDLQEGFEESLLDRELWTSVDLLQNVGIQHHQVFSRLLEAIRQSDATAEGLKDLLRDGRTGFSEWLFERFRNIATQSSPIQGAKDAFDVLLNGLAEICHSQVSSEIAVVQHEALYATTSADSTFVKLGKLGKRVLRRLGKRGFKRRFSLQKLAEFHLLGRLPERLLRIAHMLGEAEFFLLRRVKGLYEEIEQAYISYLKLLDRDPTPRVEELEEQANLMREELDESFRLVGGDVMKYYNDIRVALGREVKGGLTGLKADLLRVGTVERSVRDLHLVRGEFEMRRARIDSRLRLWGRYQVGFTGSYTMGLEMVRVQDRLRHAVDEIVLEINGRLRRRLEKIVADVDERLQKTAEILRAGRDGDEPIEVIRAQIEAERSALSDFFGRQIQGQLQAIAASGEINQLIDLLMERFRRLADQTAETFHIVEEEDLPSREGEIDEGVQLKTAPVRAVVRTYLEGGLTHRLGDVNGAMLGQVEELSRGIEELQQNLGFSLGNVAIELREAGKKPADLIPVALSRLQRALEGMQVRLDQVLKVNRETGERVVREVADTARLLKQLILEETVREMQRKVEAQRQDRIVRRLKGWKGLEELQEWGRRSMGTEAEPQARPERIEQRKGVETEGGRIEVLDYEGILDLETELATRVPFAYRRLFRTTPLEVSEFLAGRSGALGIVETAVKRWRQGRFSAVVIIGEQGSGKTSLINCAMEQKLRGLPLMRHRLEETVVDEEEFVRILGRLLEFEAKSLTDLQEQIAASHERRILLLEDLHRLHLRAVGGLDLLPRFLEFIDATGERILWLISSEQASWQYLDHVLHVSRHFAFRIETGHLSRQELEGAIMARHRATGYGLRFTGDAESEADLRRVFFDHLHRACGGNVFAAIFYWLRSIEGVEEETLLIRPLEELKLEFLRDLSLEDLLNLGMVVEHGGLTASNFSRIFRIPEGEGQARLKHLERTGILKSSEGNRRKEPIYTVNQILYHPVVSQLKRRNIVK